MILPNMQFYYFGFFTEPLLYLCVPANDSNLSEKIGHIFAVFSKSIFKVLGIYSLKIHNWHGFFYPRKEILHISTFKTSVKRSILFQ